MSGQDQPKTFPETKRKACARCGATRYDWCCRVPFAAADWCSECCPPSQRWLDTEQRNRATPDVPQPDKVAALQSQVRALREALHAAVDSWDRSNAERRHAGLIPLPDSHGPAWLKVARQALASSPQPQQETR